MTTTRTRLPDENVTTAARRGPHHRNEVTIVGDLTAPVEPRLRADGCEVLTFRLSVRTPISPTGPAAAPVGDGREPAAALRRDVVDCVALASAVRRRLEQYHPGDVVEVQGTLRHRFFNAGGRVQSRYEVEVGRLKRVARDRSAQPADPPG